MVGTNVRRRNFQTQRSSLEKISLFPQFYGKLKAKLAIDGDSIGTENDQVWYAFDRLEGKAATRIHPWISNYENDEDEFTLKNFCTQLENAFEDTAAQQKALQKLSDIQQGKRPFNEFLNEFDRLLLEARGQGWQDSIKKSFLKRALSESLKNNLIPIEEDDDYEDYCDTVRGIANRVEEFKKGRQAVPGNTKPGTAPVEPESDAMDWEPVRGAQPRDDYKGETIDKTGALTIVTPIGKILCTLSTCEKVPGRTVRGTSVCSQHKGYRCYP